MTRILVNGDPLEAPDTVDELLVAVNAPLEGVAVAINGEVVPRGERPSRRLHDGDRVEIIRAVGGG